MSAPFQPEQDIATAVASAGAVWGGSTVGGVFALIKNTNLFFGQPRSTYEEGLQAVGAATPGLWIDTETVPSKRPQTFLNAAESGSYFWAGIRLWVVTVPEQTGIDLKAQGMLVARQLRDYFHTKVYTGSARLGAYIMALCIDPGDVRIRKFTDARQVQVYTDFELQWANVN